MMKIFKLVEKYLGWLLVVIPTAAISVYSIVLAEDEFASRASVIVKENQRSAGPAIPGVAAALFDYGNRTSIEDGYLLQDFLLGEGFTLELFEELDLGAHFSSSGFPVLQRFTSAPSLGDIHDLVIDRLNVSLSTETSLLSISFRSFDPVISKQVVDWAIEQSETRINDLSERIRLSKMSLALEELDSAEEELKAANQALLDFQIRSGWLSPDSEVGSTFNQVAELRAQLVSKNLEKEQLLLTMTPESPRVGAVETEIEAIRNQLQILQSSMINSDAQSDVALSAEYNRYSLELEFARTKYGAATAALQQAQLEASQKQKFLLVVSPTVISDSPVAPTPIASILTTLVVMFLVFLVVRLVIATVRDHTV